MAKVQQISEISPNIPLTEYDFYTYTFRRTELGRMYELIPFKTIGGRLQLKETRPSHVWTQAVLLTRRQDYDTTPLQRATCAGGGTTCASLPAQVAPENTCKIRGVEETDLVPSTPLF